MEQFNFTYILIIGLPLLIAQSIGFYLLFEKAGEKGWKGLVPIYSSYIMVKLTGRPIWYFLSFFIPVIGEIVAVSVYIDFLKCYGQTKLSQYALGIVGFFVYLPMIGKSENVKYVGTLDEIPEIKKSASREWIEAIVFAVFAATLIRWAFMEAFTIPTPSMENSLLVGDFLFVSKVNYGPRTPKTPLQLPLTHQKLWFTELPSYSTALELPQMRLPGFGFVERNDVVVFNYPVDDHNNKRHDGKFHPVDLKTHYIKRCVAVPGDVIEVKDTQVYVNGALGDNPELMQFNYFVFPTTSQINDRIFKRLDITPPDKMAQDLFDQAGNRYYSIHATPEAAAQLEQLDFIKSVQKRNLPAGQKEPRIFPQSERHNWNSDNYGPLMIPGRETTITINAETLNTYQSTILTYEGHDDVKIEGDKLIIDGEEVKEYTFRQNYYFMMGDNRHNSEDSRYWGFVPENHVVGEAAFIWLSLDANESFLSKIRWRRFFKGIN